MDYNAFAEKISKLYSQYYEKKCISYKIIEKIVAEFPDDFAMYVLNEENISIMRVVWRGDIRDFYENIFSLKTKPSVFSDFKYLEMRDGIPYFGVEFC